MFQHIEVILPMSWLITVGKRLNNVSVLVFEVEKLFTR